MPQTPTSSRSRAPVAKGANASAPPEAEWRIAGRCLLPDTDERACYAQNFTTERAEIVMDADLRVGDPLICYLDNIGMVCGRVVRSLASVHYVDLEFTPGRRARVGARLEWHASRVAEAIERRAAPRIVPASQWTVLTLTNRIAFPVRIIDLSMSGVAVAVDAEYRPFVESVVMVGKRLARIVRHFERGFGAEFKIPVARESFHDRIVL